MGWIQLLTFIIASLYLRRMQELIVFVKRAIKIEVTSEVKAQTQVSTLDKVCLGIWRMWVERLC